MEYTAGRGTTALGIVGTVLGSIGTAGALGGGLLGGNAVNAYPYANPYQMGESTPVNRYEMRLQKENSELKAQVALRDASIYTDQKLNDLRNYVEHKFDHVECELRDVAVYQATNTATISCMGQQIYGLKRVLDEITAIRVPNRAVCPGWGEVTVTPVTPAAAAAAGA